MTGAARPLVSFVVPCYNYGRYLPDCLQSIFSQDADVDYEVLVIDDGSRDNTRDVIAGFADPRMRVVRHARNQGHAATINEGLAAARGRYVARIDPDDRYRPWFLASVLEKFERRPDVGLVYGDVALIDAGGEVTRERCDDVHGGRDFCGNELVALLARNFICAPSVMARREAWLSAVPVPDWLAFNDWYFTVMMARRWDFYYIDRVLADYRVHASNHHARVVRDQTEEPSIFWLLDRVFDEREALPGVDAAKRRARSRTYAAQYLALAEKYFWFEMNADARRCYLKAFRYRPACLWQPGVVRRFLATVIGRRWYEMAKATLKAASQ